LREKGERIKGRVRGVRLKAKERSKKEVGRQGRDRERSWGKVSLPTLSFRSAPMFQFMVLKKLQQICMGQMDMASKSKMKNCHFDILCCMLKRFMQERRCMLW
jgi:hypothetical protein